MAIPGQSSYIILACSRGERNKFNSFLARIIKLLKSGQRKIIIHFTDEMELDLKHLKSLHRILKLGRSKWADIKIVVPTKKMKDVFILTRLGAYSGIYTSLTEAMEGGFAPFIKYGGIVAAALFVFLYADVIRWLFFSWRIDPYYSHGVIVLAAGIYFIWKRRAKIKNARSCFSPKAFLFIFTAFLLYITGYFAGINYMRGLSLILFLLGFTLLIYGKEIYKSVFLPVIILFFAIPIPRIEELASTLQHLTAGWVASLVSKCGVEAYNIGINIFLKNTHISIDAPCSGLRSLIALLFVAALFISFLKTSTYKKLLLFLTIPPISIAANVARIAILTFIANGYGLKAALFYFHYVSGLLFFIFAVGALMLEKTVLRCAWDIT